eukprot:tig00001208_g7537.t1
MRLRAGYISPIGSPIRDDEGDEEADASEACEEHDWKVENAAPAHLISDEDALFAEAEALAFSAAAAAAPIANELRERGHQQIGDAAQAASVSPACRLGLNFTAAASPAPAVAGGAHGAASTPSGGSASQASATKSSAAAAAALQAEEPPAAVRAPPRCVDDVASVLLFIARRIASPEGRVDPAFLLQQFANWHRAVLRAAPSSSDAEHSIHAVLSKMEPHHSSLSLPSSSGSIPSDAIAARGAPGPPADPARRGLEAAPVNESRSTSKAAAGQQKLDHLAWADGCPELRSAPKNVRDLRCALLAIVRISLATAKTSRSGAKNERAAVDKGTLQSRFVAWYRSRTNNSSRRQSNDGLRLQDVLRNLSKQKPEKATSFNCALKWLLAPYAYLEGSTLGVTGVVLPSDGTCLVGNPNGSNNSPPTSMQELQSAAQGIRNLLKEIKVNANANAVLRELDAWLARVSPSNSNPAPDSAPAGASGGGRFLALYRTFPGSRPELGVVAALDHLLQYNRSRADRNTAAGRDRSGMEAEQSTAATTQSNTVIAANTEGATCTIIQTNDSDSQLGQQIFGSEAGTGGHRAAAGLLGSKTASRGLQGDALSGVTVAPSSSNQKQQNSDMRGRDWIQLLNEMPRAPQTVLELGEAMRAAARLVSERAVREGLLAKITAKHRISNLRNSALACFHRWHQNTSGVVGDGSRLGAVYRQLTGRGVPYTDLLRDFGADDIFAKAVEGLAASTLPAAAPPAPEPSGSAPSGQARRGRARTGPEPGAGGDDRDEVEDVLRELGGLGPPQNVGDLAAAVRAASRAVSRRVQRDNAVSGVPWPRKAQIRGWIAGCFMRWHERVSGMDGPSSTLADVYKRLTGKQCVNAEIMAEFGVHCVPYLDHDAGTKIATGAPLPNSNSCLPSGAPPPTGAPPLTKRSQPPDSDFVRKYFSPSEEEISEWGQTLAQEMPRAPTSAQELQSTLQAATRIVVEASQRSGFLAAVPDKNRVYAVHSRILKCFSWWHSAVAGVPADQSTLTAVFRRVAPAAPEMSLHALSKALGVGAMLQSALATLATGHGYNELGDSEQQQANQAQQKRKQGQLQDPPGPGPAAVGRTGGEKKQKLDTVYGHGGAGGAYAPTDDAEPESACPWPAPIFGGAFPGPAAPVASHHPPLSNVALRIPAESAAWASSRSPDPSFPTPRPQPAHFSAQPPSAAATSSAYLAFPAAAPEPAFCPAPPSFPAGCPLQLGAAPPPRDRAPIPAASVYSYAHPAAAAAPAPPAGPSPGGDLLTLLHLIQAFGKS